MAQEVECKYLNVDFVAFRAVLDKQGACSEGAHFERNEVFDAGDAGLFRSKRLLRLRMQEWPAVRRYLLTLKLPQQAENFKVCDEREVEVADGAATRGILEGLGYAVVARYEKIREIWRMGGAEVCLDVLPFITAVELEGAPENLRLVAESLGLVRQTASTANYHELHQEWRKQRHLPPERSFVFDQEQRDFLRKKLGLGREV